MNHIKIGIQKTTVKNSVKNRPSCFLRLL